MSEADYKRETGPTGPGKNKGGGSAPGSAPQSDDLQSLFSIRLYGKPVPDFDPTPAKPGVGVFAHIQKGDRPRIAYVYGYSYSGEQIKLPKPTGYLVSGDGRPARGWKEFPADEGFCYWDVLPSQPTFRAELQPGTFDELLLRPQTAEAAAAGSATLIRGADGRLYVIPADLSDFEVRDEGSKNELQQLADVRWEYPVRDVRSISARSSLTVRSSLTSRPAQALLATLR